MADEPDPLATANPDGVTTSNTPYWPRTLEQKAAALGVPFAGITVVEPTEPYPVGNPPNSADRVEMLERIHSPQELVQGADRDAQAEANLRAGGSVEGGQRADVSDNLGT